MCYQLSSSTMNNNNKRKLEDLSALVVMQVAAVSSAETIAVASCKSSSSSSKKRVRFYLDALDSESSTSSSSSSSSLDQSASCYYPLTATEDAADASSKRRRTEKPSSFRTVVEWLPLCCELSLSEKQDRWIQREERDAIREAANVLSAQCRQQDAWLQDNGCLSLAQSYAQVYAICQQRWGGDDDDEEGEGEGDLKLEGEDPSATEAALAVLPELISWMAGNNNARGLEDRMVPWLALARRISRAKAIQTIVKAQTVCQAEVVRAISRMLSHPSRRLGQVLAVADATAAMLEYNRSSNDASILMTAETAAPSPNNNNYMVNTEVAVSSVSSSAC